jgi:hypothetical protein
MLQESFIILMSVAAAASADDKCRGFCPFIAHKFRTYLSRQGHNAARNDYYHILCRPGRSIVMIHILYPPRPMNNSFSTPTPPADSK